MRRVLLSSPPARNARAKPFGRTCGGRAIEGDWPSTVPPVLRRTSMPGDYCAAPAPAETGTKTPRAGMHDRTPPARSARFAVSRCIVRFMSRMPLAQRSCERGTDSRDLAAGAPELRAIPRRRRGADTTPELRRPEGGPTGCGARRWVGLQPGESHSPNCVGLKADPRNVRESCGSGVSPTGRGA